MYDCKGLVLVLVPFILYLLSEVTNEVFFKGANLYAWKEPLIDSFLNETKEFHVVSFALHVTCRRMKQQYKQYI